MKGDTMREKQYISIQELADILCISRIAVYKKVKKGQIKAIRVGRSFAIPKRYVASILGKDLNSKDRQEINAAVKKTVREYGEVLKSLGRE